MFKTEELILIQQYMYYMKEHYKVRPEEKHLVVCILSQIDMLLSAPDTKEQTFDKAEERLDRKYD